MGSTLQEQFLKMGLVDKKQASKANKAQHQQRTGSRGQDHVAESKILAQKARDEKKDRVQLLNQKKNQKAKEKESTSSVRQLIEDNRVVIQEGEITYNFTDNKRIKRLYLQQDMANQLSSGALAIVRQAGEYRIVPAHIAEKVRRINRNLVVVFHSQERESSPDADDPYTEYPVPDDLTW